MREGYVAPDEVAKYETPVLKADPKKPSIPGLAVAPAVVVAKKEKSNSQSLEKGISSIKVSDSKPVPTSNPVIAVPSNEKPSVDDGQKSLKALLKKLRQIEEIETKIQQDPNLVLNEDQKGKLAKKLEIENHIKELEGNQ